MCKIVSSLSEKNCLGKRSVVPRVSSEELQPISSLIMEWIPSKTRPRFRTKQTSGRQASGYPGLQDPTKHATYQRSFFESQQGLGVEKLLEKCPQAEAGHSQAPAPSQSLKNNRPLIESSVYCARLIAAKSTAWISLHKAFKSGGQLKQSATTLFLPEIYLTSAVSCATYES